MLGLMLVLQLAICGLFYTSCSQSVKVPDEEIPAPAEEAEKVDVGYGWANNSVNAVIFRKNALVTHDNTQYIAYYNPQQYLVLAKRKLGEQDWKIQHTDYKGNTKDAHNAISIMVDGDGYLHVAWDHHNNSLRYARSLQPGSLQLSKKLPMTGTNEQSVTYPEFYRLPDGNLLFFYRYGESGNGNLVINRYSTDTQKWERLQSNLIDGEGVRNAYWQACVDAAGTIHISWVWRETWDVATNHDLSYARSRDGGKSWENSKGEKYTLPINQQRAEIAWKIPQNSELINQTSMTADSHGNPIIATYWREKSDGGPHYRVIYHDGKAWQTATVYERKTSFSLSGVGTKLIPIARPQIMVYEKGGKKGAVLVFRDHERGDRVSVAFNNHFPAAPWELAYLTREGVGAWEPSYDTELWKEKRLLHLFVQKVVQLDGEGLADAKPEMVSVLEWEPLD